MTKQMKPVKGDSMRYLIFAICIMWFLVGCGESKQKEPIAAKKEVIGEFLTEPRPFDMRWVKIYAIVDAVDGFLKVIPCNDRFLDEDCLNHICENIWISKKTAVIYADLDPLRIAIAKRKREIEEQMRKEQADEKT